MKLLKQIINLIRLQNSTDPYDKGICTHLSVKPEERQAVKACHVCKKITGTEANL